MGNNDRGSVSYGWGFAQFVIVVLALIWLAFFLIDQQEEKAQTPPAPLPTATH